MVVRPYFYIALRTASESRSEKKMKNNPLHS